MYTKELTKMISNIFTYTISSLLCLLLLGTGTSGLTAQQAHNAEIQAFRIGFYTKRLQLSPEEAKSFWPVHDAFTAEQRKAQNASKAKLNEISQGMLGASDEQLAKMGDELLDLKQAEFDLVRKYHEEFKKVLPIRKVVLLYKIEQDYKKKLLAEIRRRRQERKKNR